MRRHILFVSALSAAMLITIASSAFAQSVTPRGFDIRELIREIAPEFRPIDLTPTIDFLDSLA